MGTPLETPRSSYPGIKLRTEGQRAVLMVAHVGQTPRRDYKTNEPIVRNGKPAMQDVLTAMVMPGTTGVITDNGNDIAVAEGAIVRDFIAGKARYEMYQAKKDHGAWEVGDVIEHRHGGTEGVVDDRGNAVRDASGHQVQAKVHAFRIRRAKPEEAALVAKAEELHRQLAAGDSAPTNDDVPEEGAWDDTPF